MTISRRSILWTAPVISVAVAAPAFAKSPPPRKDPGINGWMQVAYGTSKNFDATFDSDPAGFDPSTPDGNPFGLYVFDAQPTDLFSAASITLWFRGKVGSWANGPSSTLTNGGGHGNKWSSPAYVGTVVKPDTLTYHGYRFDYSGNFVLAGGLMWLQDIEITAKRVNSDDATFWVERHIAINGVIHAFQRRNGERGSMGDGFPVGRMYSRSEVAHPSGLTGVMA